jgi:hypothetical protein
MNQKTWALGLSLLLLATAGPARAIVVVTSTPGPDNAPFTVTQIYTTDAAYTGSNFNNSGSQYEGVFTNGLNGTAATAVGPNWVLTATHLVAGDPNQGIGDTFIFNNTSYTTVRSVDVGNGMTLLEVNRAFSTFAPIFGNNDPSLQAGARSVQGATSSDFGTGVVAGIRNGAMGTPSFATTAVMGPGGGIQGYEWGGRQGGLSWGASSVLGYATDPSNNVYLVGGFNPAAGTNYTGPLGAVSMASTVATDDSGGGLFAFVNGQWQLVGVNFGVDGPYTAQAGSSPSGTYDAALFNTNGFSGGNGILPFQFSYASAITPAVAALIGATVPEPASLSLLAAGIGVVGLAHRRKKRRDRPEIPV